MQIEKLTSKLKQAETEKKELGEKLKQMESHRDYLLDKVERLHADKHKLEDRLNSQDKARLYERTLSESQAMEDLGDEYSFEEETLELYPDKVREKTESNLGVSRSGVVDDTSGVKHAANNVESSCLDRSSLIPSPSPQLLSLAVRVVAIAME